MEQLNDLLDLNGLLNRHLQPCVDRVDGLVAESLGWERYKIAKGLKNNLHMVNFNQGYKQKICDELSYIIAQVGQVGAKG